MPRETGHRAWDIVKYGYPLLPRERRILKLRDSGKTLVQVGKLLGLTAERVRQLEHQARRKLREES